MSVKASQFDLLAKLLDVANVRHRTIAQNVANVNTPGYHRLEISFEDSLARELGRPGGKTVAKLSPKVIEARGAAERADGNNVDIDAEMGHLTKNALLHNAYAQILANKIATMRSAITGR